MKLSFLLLSTMLTACAVNATAQKNTWIVDANGSYSRTTLSSTGANSAVVSPDLPLTDWSVSVNAGIQVTNHLTFGVQGGYGKSESVVYENGPAYQYQYMYKSTNWRAGVFGRYTQWVSKRFFIYGQLSVGRYGGDNTLSSLQGYYYVTPAPESTMPEGNGTYASLFPAVGVNIVNGYGLHADIGGIGYTNYNTIGTTVNKISVNLGQTFSFGIHKIIGWKKHATPAAKHTELETGK